MDQIKVGATVALKDSPEMLFVVVGISSSGRIYLERDGVSGYFARNDDLVLL